MLNTKKKPVPFSAEPEFVAFLDDCAAARDCNRSSFIRHSVKTFAKEHLPQVFARYFTNEVDRTKEADTVTQHSKPIVPIAPISKPNVIDKPLQDDFLSSITPTRDTEEITFGVPDCCPSCEVPRYEFEGGVIVKTNVICSTDPKRGTWICNECTSSGWYFPDKEPIISLT